MIKLIAFDMDDTLLRSDGSASDYTIKVLNKCKERGILIAMVTARSYGSAKPHIEAINPDIIILNGGATGYYGDKMIYDKTISSTDSSELIKLALVDSKANYIRFVGLNECYSNEPDNIRSRYYRYTENFHDVTALNLNACKISLYANAPLITELYQKISPMYDIAAFSGKLTYKISHKEALKELALQSVVKECGINLSNETIAFGDDVLDIGMLKVVKSGIAVDNALTNVKKIASHICESNDNDGVAKYIDKFILR